MVLVELSSAVGLLAISSRMLWAFAREDGVPGSKYISKVGHSDRCRTRLLIVQVNRRSALPLWSITATTAVNLLLALIVLGSQAAFNAFTGLTVAGFYSSFAISASVMLHKRLTNHTQDILRGPFRLSAALGCPITIAAIGYSVIGIFFSFWPPTATVTAATWNWSFVVYWGTIMVVLLWWWLRARDYYTGPKIELDPLQLSKLRETS